MLILLNSGKFQEPQQKDFVLGFLEDSFDQNIGIGSNEPLAQLLQIAPELIDRFEDNPIEDLDLSNRSYNGVRRSQLNTLGVLLSASECQLYNIRNLGHNSVEEIKIKLGYFFEVTVPLRDSIVSSETTWTFEPALPPPPNTWDILKPKVAAADSALFWSVPAFLDAWRALPASEGDIYYALRQRRFLASEAASQPEFDMGVLIGACRLTCHEREWSVLAERNGLNAEHKAKTLQEIAETMKVSRERVRQMETSAHKKIRKSTGIVKAFAENLPWLMEKEHGIIAIEHAVQRLSVFFPIPSDIFGAILQLFLVNSDKFQRVTRPGNLVRDASEATQGEIFGFTGQTDGFAPIIETARRLWMTRETSIQSDKWVAQILQTLRETGHEFSENYVRACLRADGRFDPGSFEVMEMARTLDLALVETLQRLGAPAHFTELTRRINEFGVWHRKAGERSVHGRLGAHPELFVCIDHGTYGLMTWGLEGQRKTRDRSVLIGDAVEEFLDARDKPAHEDDIVEYVLQKKKCQEYSITQCLYHDERFHRVSKKVYGLKKWVF